MKVAEKKRIYIRRIAGLDAMKEAIGRSVEMDRPVHYAPGTGGLIDLIAPQTLAGISILGYVATLSAQMGANLLVSTSLPEVYALAEATVQSAFLMEGIEYPKENIQWLSEGFEPAVMSLLQEMRPGANFYIGGLFAVMKIAEVGVEVGAMQIMGTTKQFQIPFCLATCDYTLMADEIYAADAYLSDNPSLSGSLRGVDIGKFIGIILILIGTILETFGITAFTEILGM